MPQRKRTTTYSILENQPVREFRYHKHGKPIPDGWRLVSDLGDTHHGYYAVLIERNNATLPPSG